MPAAPNKPWLAQGEDKRSAVRAMFSDIAPTYDRVNSVMSLSLHRRWRERAVAAAAPRPGDACLDVCCGTGDFLLPLRQAAGPDARLEGLDFCQPMLDVAAQKPGHNARLVLGDACSLPYPDASFDVVTVGWGLRNVPDLPKALAEAYRVLRPGGRMASLDMVKPSTLLGRAGDLGFRTLVPLIGRLFGKAEAYKYLPESTERFLTAEELAEAYRSAGFQPKRIDRLMMGTIALHLGIKP